MWYRRFHMYHINIHTKHGCENTEFHTRIRCRFNLKCGKCTYKATENLVATIKTPDLLQLPMQSVPITTDAVSSNLDQGDMYSIM